MNERSELSRLRRQLTSLGGQWDITMSPVRLAELIRSIQSQSTSKVLPVPRLSVRYFVLYLRLDRVLMYEKVFMPGQCKLRMSVVCPSSNRAPVAVETRFSFQAGRAISSDDNFFKLAVPLLHMSDLRLWKVEFELLHRYVAAPVFSVIARGWVDPWTLTRARGIDLGDPGIARIDFARIESSKSGINLFRAVGIAVLFAVRCGKLLLSRRKRLVQQTEGEIRFLDAKNSREKSAIQIDIMIQTIRSLNKVVTGGHAVDDNNIRFIESRLSEVAKSVEGLREDIFSKRMMEQPPVVVSITGPATIPAAVANPVASTVAVESSPITAVPTAAPSVPPTATPTAAPAPAAPASALTNATAAFWTTMGTVAEASASLVQPVGDPGGRLARRDEGPPPQAEPQSVTEDGGTNSETESVSEAAKLPPKVEPKLPPPKKTIPSVKKPGPPPKHPVPKKAVASKKPADPAKAKAVLIATLKVMEAKRKLDIEKREKQLAEIAKTLPPIDKFKFPGMPGPPPFKPKVKPEEAVLPSALKIDDEDEDEAEEE
jgi:hypothetical protein